MSNLGLSPQKQDKITPVVLEEILTDVPQLLKYVHEEIKAKRFLSLKGALDLVKPADIVELFDELEPCDMAIIFRLLPKATAAETFIDLNQSQQEYLLETLTDRELKEVTDELFLDDFADLIEEMPSNVVKRILKSTSVAKRKKINVLLGYPKDSAGSVMTTEYINLHHSLTVQESLDRIRDQALDKETIYTAYITDRTNKLIGVVSMKDLFINPLDAKIGEIMDTNIITATTETDREVVAGLLSRYDFLALPIVDTENHMVGIVTVDDALDVLEEEVTEDITKMAAIIPENKPYFETNVLSTCKSRLPWLLLLMISATFSSVILTSFENRLAAISVLLIACVPMLMDTGGNAGSQSCVVVIRGMVLNDIEFKDIMKVVWKEFLVGVILGVALAIACFGKLVLVDGIIMKTIDVTTSKGLMTVFTVCLTMFLTVVISKLIGSTLPLFAKKIKLDPAIVASPIITTIVDTLALLVFCYLAIGMLQ